MSTRTHPAPLPHRQAGTAPRPDWDFPEELQEYADGTPPPAPSPHLNAWLVATLVMTWATGIVAYVALVRP